MARRSPQNERYGKFTAPSGQTRKSAASAKPKRDSSTPQKQTTTKKKKPTAARQPLIINPPTPEFRAMRRTWWILLGSSLVFTLASLGVRQLLNQPLLANILLVIGYGGIFAALYIDWAKLRPMRQRYMESQAAGGKNKKNAQDASTKDGSAKDE